MNLQSFRADDNADTHMKTIVEQYQNMVYSIALTHVGCRSDADDVFQDVFLIYWQKHPEFNEEEHRKAWLINTTLNCCKRTTGRTWRKKTVSLTDLPDQPVLFSCKEENEVFIALRQLPVKYRTVLHLFYFEDMPVEKISALLHIRQGTVRMQLTRGRDMMRELLDRMKGELSYG